MKLTARKSRKGSGDMSWCMSGVTRVVTRGLMSHVCHSCQVSDPMSTPAPPHCSGRLEQSVLSDNLIRQCLHLENIKLRSTVHPSKSFFLKPQSLKSSISNDQFCYDKKTRQLFVRPVSSLTPKPCRNAVAGGWCRNKYKTLLSQ